MIAILMRLLGSSGRRILIPVIVAVAGLLLMPLAVLAAPDMQTSPDDLSSVSTPADNGGLSFATGDQAAVIESIESLTGTPFQTAEVVTVTPLLTADSPLFDVDLNQVDEASMPNMSTACVPVRVEQMTSSGWVVVADLGNQCMQSLINGNLNDIPVLSMLMSENLMGPFRFEARVPLFNRSERIIFSHPFTLG
jgi:hypothetical protein